MTTYLVQIEEQNEDFKIKALDIDSLIEYIESEYKIINLEKCKYEEFLYIGQDYYEGSEIVNVYIEKETSIHIERRIKDLFKEIDEHIHLDRKDCVQCDEIYHTIQDEKKELEKINKIGKDLKL